MFNNRQVGEKITVARKLKNLSQAQVGELLSVSAQAVGKWERGEALPDILQLARLAAALGTDVNYFVGLQTSLTPETFGESEGADEAFEERSGWNLSGGVWVDADFSGLSGLAERLSGSNIDKCKFLDSELSGLILKGNNIQRSDFSRSDLSKCQFLSSNLQNTVFADCSLCSCEISKTNISSCDLSGANLSSLNVKWSNLEKLGLSGATLYRTSFNHTQLSDITFTGMLTECFFENCDLARVVFENATLKDCFFKNAKMRRAKMIACKADKLTYAFLKACKADMTGVTIIEKSDF